ncbi:MAG: radical SAM protein [bacterium]|nr:radical SAM protein [bacterium]
MSQPVTFENQSFNPKKILLAILPYWDPMIPPMGITSLKQFLESHGYRVKTVDLIVQQECFDYYHNYFEVLKRFIPEEKRGNFNNIGHDVLQSHLMAHWTHSDEGEYIRLVKQLIYHSYYVDAEIDYIQELNRLTAELYTFLETYFTGLLEKEKPDVFGLTAYKCTIATSMFVLKLVKERYPHIKTMMGGGTFNESHAPDSPNFQALLKASAGYLDKIILGPGELLFLEYLRGNLPETQRVYTRDDIGGKILPFEQSQIPDFSDLDTQRYPYLAATASASCLYECSFCTAKKVAGQYRMKAYRQTVEEMIRLYEEHGHQLFFMTDSLLNPVIDGLSDAFIESGVSLYYDAYFKVDTPSEKIENTLRWRKGGLYRVRLGTESGSQEILDRMNKGITVDQIRAAISALAYAGIKTTTYWVIGHPGETEEDFQQTLDLIEELKDDIYQAECNPMLYHYSKQFASDEWSQKMKRLYPRELQKMLVFEYYDMECQPSRQETYNRMHRFEAHCRKVGVPNPYALNEHKAADERWKKLHKNAVPAMVEFIQRKNYIDENKRIQIENFARSIRQEEDFDF